MRLGRGRLAFPEGRIGLLVGKKLGQGASRDRQGFVHQGGGPLGQAGQIYRRVVAAHAQGRPYGGGALGVGQGHYGFRLQVEGGDEELFELRQKMQGAAQKGHLACNGPAAGQTADSLLHHSLQNGGRNVLAGHAAIEQGHNVRLGEHAAARSNGVEGCVTRGQGVEPSGVGIEQTGHLVDEGPCAAGTGFVHAQFHILPEVEQLGVLAAKLHGHCGVWCGVAHGAGRGQQFLHEGKVEPRAQIKRARSGDGGDNARAGTAGRQIRQQTGEGGAHRSAVSVVTSFQNMAVGVQQGQFYCSGADIQAQQSRRIR